MQLALHKAADELVPQGFLKREARRRDHRLSSNGKHLLYPRSRSHCGGRSENQQRRPSAPGRARGLGTPWVGLGAGSPGRARGRRDSESLPPSGLPRCTQGSLVRTALLPRLLPARRGTSPSPVAASTRRRTWTPQPPLRAQQGLRGPARLLYSWRLAVGSWCGQSPGLRRGGGRTSPRPHSAVQPDREREPVGPAFTCLSGAHWEHRNQARQARTGMVPTGRPQGADGHMLSPAIPWPACVSPESTVVGCRGGQRRPHAPSQGHIRVLAHEVREPKPSP